MCMCICAGGCCCPSMATPAPPRGGLKEEPLELLMELKRRMKPPCRNRMFVTPRAGCPATHVVSHSHSHQSYTSFGALLPSSFCLFWWGGPRRSLPSVTHLRCLRYYAVCCYWHLRTSIHVVFLSGPIRHTICLEAHQSRRTLIRPMFELDLFHFLDSLRAILSAYIVHKVSHLPGNCSSRSFHSSHRSLLRRPNLLGRLSLGLL